MPLKTIRRTQAVGRVLGEGCALRTHFFLCKNFSSVPDMKTQTDKANLGVVVKSIPGRGRECEVHGVNDGNRAQPWGFVCSKGNGLQSNTGRGKKGGRRGQGLGFRHSARADAESSCPLWANLALVCTSVPSGV